MIPYMTEGSNFLMDAYPARVGPVELKSLMEKRI